MNPSGSVGIHINIWMEALIEVSRVSDRVFDVIEAINQVGPLISFPSSSLFFFFFLSSL